jgi:hypothetical protein
MATQREDSMTYKNNFADTPAADAPVQSFGTTSFNDDAGAPNAGNSVSDAGDGSGGDSGIVLSFNTHDLGLDDILARAVQVGPLVDGDCQPCANDTGSSDSGSSDTGGSLLNAHVDVGTGTDASGLTIAPHSLLSGLLGGSDYTGAHDDAAGSTTACSTTTGSSTDSGADVADAGATHAGISVDANLGLDGGTGGDVLSALLNGTSLLGDSGGSDGLLNGAIVTADGNAASDTGMSVDPGLTHAVGGVLDGLLGSTDLLHASDCGCAST